MAISGHRQQRTAPPAARAGASAVVAKALSRASKKLQISQSSVAAIIGVSPSKVTRVFKGQSELSVIGKEGQLALLFLRVFRSLDTVVGGDEQALRSWFHGKNAHLGGVPSKLVESPQGLVNVADYLDAMRGTL